MLTLREQAAGHYNAALSQGRRRVHGAESMTAITSERLQNVRRAEQTIRAAQGTERRFVREPTDELLAQMLEKMTELAGTLEGDGTRWADRAAG